MSIVRTAEKPIQTCSVVKGNVERFGSWCKKLVRAGTSATKESGVKRCWILILLVSTAFGQSKDASVTGHDWNSFSDPLKTGYALGFVNGTALGAIREANLCFQLVNISLGIVTNSTDFFKQWNDKYPDLSLNATSQMLGQTNRPEFKEQFCLKSFSSGFEKITVGQFVSGVNAFFQDYRNQNLPVNYAMQYVRDEINGKSPTELNADILLERRCIADSKACIETKPDSPKP